MNANTSKMKEARRGLLALAAAALAVMATLALGGCSASGGSDSAQPEGAQDALARIQQDGKITFATEGTWSPWTFHTEDGNLTGYDIEVARAIAEQMGVEPEFVEGEWDGLFADMDAGRYDAVANGVDVTEERAEKYDFSDPYAYNRTVVIVRDDEDDINSMEDLAGKTTANTLSSTYTQVAESYGAKTQGVDDLLQTIQLLEQGRIDATLNSEVVFYDYMTQHPDAKLKIACVDPNPTTVAIPLVKGESSQALLDAMNAALEELRVSGRLAELSNQFFGVDITEQ